MDRDQFIEAVKKINVWKKHDQRALHKPLILLYALAKLQLDEPW